MKLNLTGALYPDNESVKNLREVLAKNPNEDIEIDVNSPGGLVTLGIELFNRIKEHNGNVKINVIGQASSMASYIVLAGDEINVYDNSIFMIHNASGIAWGDYRVMNKYAALLDSMSSLVALKYVEKTGKEMSVIRGKMDDETFLFGKEIKDFGFADNVLKSDDKKDKDTAKAESMIEIQACIDEMKNHEISDQDLNKIAAHIKETKPESKKQNPDNRGNQEEEKEKSMSLVKLMAENPGIKAEVDALVRAAKEDGFKDGKSKVENRIKAASPYIGKTDYPEAITTLAVGVVNGEKDPTALEGAVVAFDAMKQQDESNKAKGENGDETPPEHPDKKDDDGVIASEENYQAELEKTKKARGDK